MSPATSIEPSIARLVTLFVPTFSGSEFLLNGTRGHFVALTAIHYIW